AHSLYRPAGRRNGEGGAGIKRAVCLRSRRELRPAVQPHPRFPVEWSAFVNGAANFTATIPRDFFPYFTRGKALTITAIEIYGTDLKHHVVGNSGAATNDLADKNKLAFTVNI